MNVLTIIIGRGPIFSDRKSKKSLSIPLSRLAVRDAQTKVRVNLTPQVSRALAPSRVNSLQNPKCSIGVLKIVEEVWKGILFPDLW